MTSMFSWGFMVNDGSTSPSTSVDTTATIFDETQVEYNAPNSKISMARKRRLRLKQSRICRKLTDDMKSPIGLVISFCDENTPNENNIKDESHSIVSDVSTGNVSKSTTTVISNIPKLSKETR